MQPYNTHFIQNFVVIFLFLKPCKNVPNFCLNLLVAFVFSSALLPYYILLRLKLTRLERTLLFISIYRCTKWISLAVLHTNLIEGYFNHLKIFTTEILIVNIDERSKIVKLIVEYGVCYSSFFCLQCIYKKAVSVSQYKA